MKIIKLLLAITIAISIIGCNKQTDSIISIPVENISLDKTEVTLIVGESIKLKTNITPENATFKMLIWSSDKESVATVTDSGIVTAVGKGIAIITVEPSTGDKKAICKITVNEINNKEEDDTTAPTIPESPSDPDDEQTEIILIFNPIGGLWTNGTSDKKSISGKVNEKIVAPENPTKTGYSFDGWNNIIPEEFPDKNVEYTAKWTLINYPITYNLDGGTNNDSNPNDYTIESETFVFANPIKSGYTFDGWYTDENLTTQITEIAKGTTENVNLYAKWSLINYTIKYNLDGGTNNDSNPNDYTIESETFVFANPIKSGYTFDGWYTDENLTTRITEIAKGTTENVTLYSKWTKTILGITAELPSDKQNKLNIKHNVWISENYNVIEDHFTVSEGFESYEWWADSEKQPAICEEFIFATAGNVYGLKSAFSVGTHIITVIAKDYDGLYYSASYTLVVE